jgi:hypothetical protein
MLPFDNQSTILQLINIIGEDNEVASNRVSISGSPSKQWLSFNLLLHLCDVEEFVKMTENEISSIRVYGYFGLIFKNYVDLDNVRKKLLLDYSIVNTFFGCIKSISIVAECVTNSEEWINNESTKKFLQNISNDEVRKNKLIENLINKKKFWLLME